MNRNYIDTHLAVDRYLRNALSDTELAEFEERLAWDRTLQDDVDLAGKLREGLRRARELGGIPADGITLTGRVFGFFEVPAYAAAASFALAVGMTWFVIGGNSPDGTTSGTDPLLTEIVPLFATRSTVATRVAVADDAWTVLLVDAPAGYQRFRVSITRRDDDSVVWSRDGLAATYPDSLAIGMPGSELADGEHLLSLEGIPQDGAAYEPVQELAFIVTHAD